MSIKQAEYIAEACKGDVTEITIALLEAYRDGYKEAADVAIDRLTNHSASIEEPQKEK